MQHRIIRNQLYIVGPDVNEVLAQLGYSEKKGELDFGLLIPYPSEYQTLDERAYRYELEVARINGTYERSATRTRKLQELAYEFGVRPGTLRLESGLEQGGYVWRLKNWGCDLPIDVFVNKKVGHIGSYLDIYFVTADGSPLPIIAMLADLNQDYEFWLHYQQTWDKVEGHIQWIAGVETFRINGRGRVLGISRIDSERRA